MPIGSGVVEATCKTLVTERLKRSGMRWSERGGQAILTLRALLQSHRFESGWSLLLQTYRADVSAPDNRCAPAPTKNPLKMISFGGTPHHFAPPAFVPPPGTPRLPRRVSRPRAPELPFVAPRGAAFGLPRGVDTSATGSSTLPSWPCSGIRTSRDESVLETRRCKSSSAVKLITGCSTGDGSNEWDSNIHCGSSRSWPSLVTTRRWHSPLLVSLRSTTAVCPNSGWCG